IKQISVFDKVVSLTKAFKVKGGKPEESITTYLENLGDAKNTGKFPPHPSDYALSQLAPANVSEKVSETLEVVEAVLKVNKKNQEALGSIHKSLITRNTPYKLIGHTKTHIICEHTKDGNTSTEIIAKNEFIGNYKNLTLVGFVQVGQHLIVKDVNGRLVVFD